MSKMARATCELLGHKAPVADRNGEPYLTAKPGEVDGTGWQHVRLVGACTRCGQDFTIAKIHATKDGTPAGLIHQKPGQLLPKEPKPTGPHSTSLLEHANFYRWMRSHPHSEWPEVAWYAPMGETLDAALREAIVAQRTKPLKPADGWIAWHPHHDAAPPVPGDTIVAALLVDGRFYGPAPAKLMNWGLTPEPEGRIAWYEVRSIEQHTRAHGSVDTDAQPVVPGLQNVGLSPN